MARRTGESKPWKDFFTVAVVAGIIDLVVLVGAIAWATKVGYVSQILGGAIGVIAIVSFVGFFKEFAPDHDGRMRAAITASFLMVYMFVFGLVALSPQLQHRVTGKYGDENQNATLETSPAIAGEPESGSQTESRETVADDLFDSLSGVVTAIVAFYFGGAALEGAASKLAGRKTPDSAQPEVSGSLP